MLDPAITEAALEAAASEPASHTADGETVVAHSLPNQIALDKYAAEKSAVAGTNANGGRRSGWGGLRPAQAVLPGGV